MTDRQDLLAELLALAEDEELSLDARAAISLVLPDLGNRMRDGLQLPTDDALHALVIAGRDVARGTGGLADLSVAALLVLAPASVSMAAE